MSRGLLAQYNLPPVPVPDSFFAPDSPAARPPSDAPPPEPLHLWAARMSARDDDWPDLRARRQLVAALAEAVVETREALSRAVCAGLPIAPEEFVLVELSPLARSLREATGSPRGSLDGAGFEVSQATSTLAVALSPAMGWGAAVAVAAQAFLEGAATAWLCPAETHRGLDAVTALARTVGLPPGCWVRHEASLDADLALTLREAGIGRAVWMAEARESRAFRAEALADGLATRVHDVGSAVAVVLRDADLPAAAEAIVGARLRLGCTRFDGPQRVLVDDSVHDALGAHLTAALARAARDPFVRHSLRALPRGAREALHARLHDAFGHGASLLSGSVPTADGPVSPCLLVGCADYPRAVAPWVAAPLLALVPFAQDDDALGLARTAPLGAVAAVFGADEDRAVTLAAGLDVDVVHLNDIPDGGLELLGARCSEGFASRTLRVLPGRGRGPGRRGPPYHPLWVRTTGLRMVLTEGRHGLRGRLGELW